MPRSSTTRRTIAAISGTVKPEYRPIGGFVSLRSSWRRVLGAAIDVSCTRLHREKSHGNTTRSTSGISASHPNIVISTAPRTGSLLPRCTL